MDSFSVNLSQIIKEIDYSIQNPENFINLKNDEDSKRMTQLVKRVYDTSKILDNNKDCGNALPELITDGFDDEQIWQQIELENNDSFPKLHLFLSIPENERKILFQKAVINEINKDASISVGSDNEKIDNSVNCDSDEDDDEDDYDDNKTNSSRSKLDASFVKETMKKSIVDDEFFKLSEMEEFLLAEEKKLEVDDDEENHIGINLFEDFPSSGDDEDKVRYRYKDFFSTKKISDNKCKKSSRVMDDEDSNHNIVNEELVEDDEYQDDIENNSTDGHIVQSENKSNKKKHITFNISQDESEDESDSSEGIESDNNEKTINKSSLEKRKERLTKYIGRLEEQAISEKPWQLKGEIAAKSRPQNSLLEEVLEFDITSRPAPIMTEKTTERLEDIICRRIKDKAWDDVEKKMKPVHTINEFKKRMILDQEKSKLSLAEIYEQEYIKQRDSLTAAGVKADETEPEELPKHKLIKIMMASIFSKLNSLANFHYTPKPAAPDVKIISNLPAITMEEVAPVTASDATLLAPEEVLGKKKKDLIGKEERTKTDKKRERRKKKNFQKSKKKLEESKSTYENNNSKNYSIEKANADLKKLSHKRNVKIVDDPHKKTIKTSTAFFENLQDKVTSKIGAQKRKKQENIITAKMLKL